MKKLANKIYFNIVYNFYLDREPNKLVSLILNKLYKFSK